MISKLSFTLLIFLLLAPSVYGQVNLNFEIDENYLIVHTLAKGRSRGKFSEDVKKFQNEMFEKYKKEYRQLQKIPINKINPVTIKKSSFSFFSKLFPEIKKSDSYRAILKQTQEYKEEIRIEWFKNYEKSFEIMKSVSKLDLKENFEIIVTHPAVGNGTNLRNYTIVWGSWGEWNNYATIYLWHEILHTFLEGKSNIEHSIIQYAADNELRRRLNGTNYPPFVGHKRLLPTMNLLFDDWEMFLKNGEEDIKAWSKKMHHKYSKNIHYF